MRSAHIHSISESEHWWEYAEPAHIERLDWVERTTERMRKDEEAAALFYAAVSLGIIFLLTYVLPAVWRAYR